MSITQPGRAKRAVHASHPPHDATSPEPMPPNWAMQQRRRWVLPVILLAAVVPLGIGVKMLLNESTKVTDTLVLYTIKRGTLPITVTERGNLESQKTEEIICEVENFGGDRSGMTGTQILYVVPNGSSVKKGDLLVELDSAPLQERLDSQFLSLQRAEAEKIQANSKYDNQVTQNETNVAEAELKLKLAEIDMNSYEDETGGTFQIELQNIEMEIQTARAQQVISIADKDAIEELHKLGYKSKGDLQAARLAFLKANSSLASQLARAKQLQKYTYQMEKLDRKGRFDTAGRNLTQIKRNNESELAQAEAARDSADRAYEKEKERYERYKEQLDKCKIYAPSDGMVAYAIEGGRGGRGSSIEEGAFIRQRQQILTLPDLTRMQVSTAVHESVLDQVRPGLKSVIRVDAFSDRSYQGTVKSVAVLPDQGGWMSSDTKVYKTTVTIDEDVTQLKPGMTAVVEIDIERLRDVISVPIQAIVQRGSKNWCYVNVAGDVQKREVTLGKTNDKFVEIKEGLVEGDVVVLNPMNLVDEETAEERKKEATAGKEGEAADQETPDSETAPDAPVDGGVDAPATSPAAGAEATSEKEAGPGAGGRGFGKKGPGGGRGMFNFAALDKDGDGQVTKEELPERMQQMIDTFDKNGDGAIQQDEFPTPGSAPGRPRGGKPPAQ